MNYENKSILIVDDDVTNLKILQEILKSRYKVYAATSGQKALDFLKKTIPNLILLDVEMPEMSGYDVIKRLKNDYRWQDIPVVFLTAQEGRDKEEQALQLGAMDYILKPVSAGVVLARVDLHLQLENYKRNLESMVEQKTLQLSNIQEATLKILANITAFRDNETGAHIKRTTIYTKLLIENLQKENYENLHDPNYQVTDEYVQYTIKSAKLHDIGKVAVPDLILLKPGRLTPEEFDQIKLHTKYGAQMIEEAMNDLGDDSSFLNVAKEIVVGHHEWWNGNGYPYGLKGHEIPISARIMAIADVYDALISKRPYKKAFTHEESVDIIFSEGGTHFDPLLLDVSKDIIEEFKNVASEHLDEEAPEWAKLREESVINKTT